MIQHKGKDLKYLQDFRNGKIKLGLGIGCDMDKHIRFKKGQLVIFMGHDNVGKTYFYTFYALCLALKHGTKFCFWTGENSSGNVMRDLIQMYEGKPFHEIPMSQIHSTYAYADACLIDPYTGLDRDITHQGNYKFLNSAREFTNRTQKTVYVSSHPNSEAGRAGNVYPEGHEWAGHLKAPLKANIEGGKSFLNRTDDMFTVHRLVSSPTMKFETMVTVEKIKDRVTGGECTNLNEPLLFNFNNGNGFTQGHNNPLKKLRGGDEVVKTHTNTLRDFRKATSTEQDLQDFNF